MANTLTAKSRLWTVSLMFQEAFASPVAQRPLNMFNSKASVLSILWVALGVLANATVWADVRLPKLVTDDMVLQRDARVQIWGWADPGEKVEIRFHGQQVSTKAGRNGEWSAALGPFAAGGPYEMTIIGKNQVELHDVLLGDVWLASGQSNMEFPVKSNGDWALGIENADEEIARANFPRIRLLTVDHVAALTPQTDVRADGWHAVTPETVARFSAVAYLFGRELHQRYRVPIGLIASTWGGSVAEAWMSGPGLRSFPEFRSAIESIAHVDERARNAYEQRQRQRIAWYHAHGAEDRGRVNDRDIWADPKYDVSGWPTITVPRPEGHGGKDFNGFDGVVWFRRAIELSPELAGKEMILHLGWVEKNDVTYFNGERIGATQGGRERTYVVPGTAVHPGHNVITVRAAGMADPTDPYKFGVGLLGPADKMRAEVGTSTLSLAGMWLYSPGADLRDYPGDDPDSTAGQPEPGKPTELFNGMVTSLIRYRIKGVIWYQGEANVGRADQYRMLFPALIQDWRRQWGYQFPFLFVQLAGFGPPQPESDECSFAELREAQTSALRLPNTGMATAIDVGDADDIHPRNKQDVAHRLALAAAKVAYGENVTDSGPTYASMQVEGDQIRVKFSNLGGGLQIKDKYGYARGFEIAGNDGKFTWAKAQLDGSDILVHSPTIASPTSLRYDWSNTPDGNVFNTEGLPALPFRAAATQR